MGKQRIVKPPSRRALRRAHRRALRRALRQRPPHEVSPAPVTLLGETTPPLPLPEEPAQAAPRPEYTVDSVRLVADLEGPLVTVVGEDGVHLGRIRRESKTKWWPGVCTPEGLIQPLAACSTRGMAVASILVEFQRVQ